MRRLHSTLVGLASVWLASFAQAGVTASCVIDPAYRTGTTLTAPAFVAIECTGSTHTDPDVRPFHDLRFFLSYNDSLCSSGTGTWANSDSDAPKNSDVSPVGGHIYECAGTYQMTATVCDSVGDCDTWTSTSFTVQDEDSGWPTTATKCVSTSGNFTGCPTGATQTTSTDYDTSLQTTAGTRTLFRCGETFVASTNVITSDASTNGSLIGSYGTQPCQATIAVNYGGALHSPLAINGLQVSGWRVRDVMYDHSNQTGSSDRVWNIWDGGAGGASEKVNMMLLRIGVLGVWACPSIGNTGTTNTWNYRIAIVGISCIADEAGGNLYYLMPFPTFHDGIIVGNTWEGRRAASAEGAMRIYAMRYMLMAHNKIKMAANGANLALQFRESQGSAGIPSNYVVFQDNRFEDDGTEYVASLALWRQCGGSCAPPNDADGRNFIIEGNRFTYGTTYARASSVDTVIVNEKNDVTIRNNIIDWRNFAGSGEDLLAIGTAFHGYSPSGVHIYNNTIIRAGSTTRHAYACRSPGGANSVCRNNLIYDVDDTDDNAFTVSGSFSLVGQNIHQNTSSCSFYGASGSCELIGTCASGLGVDFDCFKLRTSGGGVGSVKDAGFTFPETAAGYADYVYRDAFGGCRGGSTGGPDGLWDIGAHERDSTDCLAAQASPGVFRGGILRGSTLR